MPADRLRRLGFGFGSAALLMQGWLCARLLGDLADSASSLSDVATSHMLKTRMSQLKPIAFKYPWLWLYGFLFVAALAALVVAIWVVALRDLFRREPEA